MDNTTCAVRAAWRITKFYRRESCGQCTPCREGSGWVEKIMQRIEHGPALGGEGISRTPERLTNIAFRRAYHASSLTLITIPEKVYHNPPQGHGVA
jgi:NADH:ubiquinone oxidoreductase subunit F (NADH-binding)